MSFTRPEIEPRTFSNATPTCANSSLPGTCTGWSRRPSATALAPANSAPDERRTLRTVAKPNAAMASTSSAPVPAIVASPSRRASWACLAPAAAISCFSLVISSIALYRAPARGAPLLISISPAASLLPACCSAIASRISCSYGSWALKIWSKAALSLASTMVGSYSFRPLSMSAMPCSSWAIAALAVVPSLARTRR